MLAYFPTIYPGELLYSVLARYQRHVGMPGMMHTLDELFGNRKVIASFDLPGHLQALVDNIPAEHGITIDFIIDALTLYPYFTAFEPPALQAQVRKAMHIGAIDGLHVRLGLAAYRIERVSRFRFCMDCSRKMLEQYGELYWRRDHQLPSAFVCPEHGLPLQESSVLLTQCSRHKFTAASPDNCPTDAKPVLTENDPAILAHLQRLARSSTRLLDEPPARSFAEWTSFYRRSMLELGLARTAKTMNQQQLDKAFRGFYGRVLEVLPSVMVEGKFAGEWLAAMVRKHRKASHPLYHLLFQDFLTQQEIYRSPFGHGPWPCRNPLADHQNQLVIQSITQHRNHGRKVGVFSCSCGYVYTRCFDPVSDHLGPPRFLRYGVSLRPILLKLIGQNKSLREIGRVIHLDPKTVVRLIEKLRLEGSLGDDHLDKNKAGPDRCNLSFDAVDKNLASRIRVATARKKRCDWDLVDFEWLARAMLIVPQLLKVVPPLRITMSEVERRLGQCGYIEKRRHKLPKTFNFIKGVTESVCDFQVRRIKWAIVELESEVGIPKAWQVMRKAGVKSSYLNTIESLLNAS